MTEDRYRPTVQAQLLLWKPATWLEVVRVLRELDGWLFRGQADARWQLKTSLERVHYAAEPGASMQEREEEALNSFRRQALHHLEHIPIDDLEWLSLIQHHGGPTRLLDFTHSFYVAAFFAMEEADETATIWAVNQPLLDAQMMTATGRADEGNHSPTVRFVAKKVTNDSIIPTTTPAGEAQNARWLPMMPDDIRPYPPEMLPSVVAVKPWRLNQRMIIQQGWFLFPTRLDQRFEHSMCQAFDYDGEWLPDKSQVHSADELQNRITGAAPPVGLVKVILPGRIHADALRDLSRMNISAATLFPGLDGFARSLKLSLRMYGCAAEASQ